jgi:hypothetical protein
MAAFPSSKRQARCLGSVRQLKHWVREFENCSSLECVWHLFDDLRRDFFNVKVKVSYDAVQARGGGNRGIYLSFL